MPSKECQLHVTKHYAKDAVNATLSVDFCVTPCGST
jgi:hypothetical protein